MRLAYITDQFLPTHSTDTIQILSMASAFGTAGINLTLVPPAMPGRAPTREILALHYGVEPAFGLLPLAGPYPAPLGLRGFEKLFHAGKAAARVRALDVDAVYTRNLPIALAALAGTKLPVFYETYRPWPAQSRSKHFLFQALKRAPRFAGLILHSVLAAKSYAALGYEPERLFPAHNGIDPRRFAILEPRNVARARLDLASERRILAVYTGHVSTAKGLGLVLDAAERTPEIAFAIVGSTSDGPIERRAGAMPNVRVYAWQKPDEVAAWLAAADLLLIPPVLGPLEKIGNTVLPMKTFQYLAAERPIIAAATPDLLEVLTDGINARLVPPDDLGAFVTALRILAAEPDLRARLGGAGRETALANSWQARAERIRDFIATRLAAREK